MIYRAIELRKLFSKVLLDLSNELYNSKKTCIVDDKIYIDFTNNKIKKAFEKSVIENIESNFSFGLKLLLIDTCFSKNHYKYSNNKSLKYDVNLDSSFFMINIYEFNVFLNKLIEKLNKLYKNDKLGKKIYIISHENLSSDDIIYFLMKRFTLNLITAQYSSIESYFISDNNDSRELPDYIECKLELQLKKQGVM